MAKNKSTVYLGYEDDEISIKHINHLNSTVNKIGGTPDWPSTEIRVPVCPLCGTARPLIVQLYAPLEHSQFHRSLYVFACLNPACSQSSKNWICIRTQHLDTLNPAEIINAVPAPHTGATSKSKKKKKQPNLTVPKISWCSGANDWGDVDYEDMDTAADDEMQNEANGNIVEKQNISPPATDGFEKPDTDIVEDDDDDDESTSMENDLICDFAQIDMNSPQNGAEDPNANCAAGITLPSMNDAMSGGIADGNALPNTCAEIEGTETDMVIVETPKKPERDLIALLKHSSNSVAFGNLARSIDVTLKPYFMSVDIEQRSSEFDYQYYNGSLSSDHIRELYQEYKQQEERLQSPSSSVKPVPSSDNVVSEAAGSSAEDNEAYEKVCPAHGDMIFHNFLTTIQQNPGQLLRYSRDTLPLLIAPLAEPIPKCQNCNGETICEVQILSTLIPKLRLQHNDEIAPIEFGNVLIFTCLKSCWDTPDKMRYERIIVQAEL